VINLPISEKNTRTLITLPKELKEQLEKEAKEENRSFNNYVITILENRNKKEV
jgi:predicted HicB family RNase H-like nuclease